MNKRTKTIVIMFLSFLAAATAVAQGSDSVLEQARVAYRDESFERAYAIVAEGVPETTADTKLKVRTAEFLSGIALQEYGIRNFKNAYEAFRKALKYDSTNAQATSYFLKMRREMTVSALANEAPSRVKAESPAAIASGPAAVSAGSLPAAVSAAPPVAAAVPDVQLTELKGALDDASSRLRAMESSVSSTSDENKILKAQVEQQLALLQTFIDRQATAAVKPAAVAAPTSTAQEKALIAQTVQLLAKMSEQESAPTQIVVQSDPALKDLVARLETNQGNARQGGSLDFLIVIVLIVLGAAFFGLVVFLFVAAARSRKRNSSRFEPGLDGSSMQNKAMGGGSFAAIGQNRSETPLLEFIDSSAPVGGTTDLAIRKDLLKAERLNRMYEEVRTGSLGWDTVRQYIGELEVSLRSEILKTVERKLDEGDLLSSDAILPIIFPFLTDYDDYVREKSENLARRALTDTRKGRDKEGDPSLDSDDLDPLSVKTLMDIPRKLKLVFKDHDQTLMTAKICRGMGSVLGLSTEDRNLLYKTALAHDCGYLLLDRDRLARTIAKPEIDDEDFEFIQSHVTLGSTYFGEVDLPEHFRGGLISHHERNDGSGYPGGLKKDEIPLFAKLIGISETFAALVSHRAHRDKREVTHALAIISDGARSKFDAAHVEALIKVASTMGVS